MTQFYCYGTKIFKFVIISSNSPAGSVLSFVNVSSKKKKKNLLGERMNERGIQVIHLRETWSVLRQQIHS